MPGHCRRYARVLKGSGRAEVSRGHSTGHLNSPGRPESFNQGSTNQMSKESEERPKAAKAGVQGNLFASQRTVSPRPGSGTAKGEARALLSSRLARQRALTIGIMDKISSYGPLAKAFKQVRRNGGAAGADGVTIAEYERGIGLRLKRLHERLMSGSYCPQEVLGVEIPKASGGVRLLGIPTVEDRIVQQSIQSALQPVYDPEFSEDSYGFRIGRSAAQAAGRASEHVKSGKVWTVDIDLKSFFDEINHDRLMSRLGKTISDVRLLRLIALYLRSGMMLGGVSSQRTKGAPQGGPLSPLLSNIVLDELDWELELRGLSFARYADDCNIFVKTERSAQRAMKSLTKFIEESLKLKVNREKSGVRPCREVKFLGYTVEANGKLRIADANLKRFKKRVRELTKRNRGLPFKAVIAEVNELLQGWGAYYRPCSTWLSKLRDLDGWIRNRLRCYALKQHQKRYPVFRFLRGLGMRENQAWNAVMYHSWWAMANLPRVRKAMGLKWFAGQGLRSLEVIQRG